MPRRKGTNKNSTSNSLNCIEPSLLHDTIKQQPNIFASFQTSLLRNDPVTARAISRLSHGVARLTASSSPPCKSRLFRSHNIKLPEFVTSENPLVVTERSVTTGSKRRWQSDRNTLDAPMDFEHSDFGLPPSQSSVPIDHSFIFVSALNLQTGIIPTYTPYVSSTLRRSMSSDNIYYTSRYSSCSSMLSLTASSDNTDSDASPHEHDADVEDEDHNDQCTSLRQSTRTLRRKPTFEKYSNELSWKSNQTVCGGDSSDGLSVNIKIPRLSVPHGMAVSSVQCATAYGSVGDGHLLPSTSSGKRLIRRSKQKRLDNNCQFVANKEETPQDLFDRGEKHFSGSQKYFQSSNSSTSLSTDESSDINNPRYRIFAQQSYKTRLRGKHDLFRL